jgi:hypothetical protein
VRLIMKSKTEAKPNTADRTNGNVKVPHEPLRHSEMYVSLLLSLFVSLLG